MDIANDEINLEIPQAEIETGLYIFPFLRATCSGDLRQWDVVAHHSGTIYLDVWRFNKQSQSLTLAHSTKFDAEGSGMVGIVMKIEDRFAVYEGDYFGIHYDTMGEFNQSVIFNKPIDQQEDCKDFFDENCQSVFEAVEVFNLQHGSEMAIDKLTKLETRFHPALIAYITIGETVPIKTSVVQALPILSTLSMFVGCCGLIAVIVLWHRYLGDVRMLPDTNSFAVDEKRTNIGDKFFRTSTRCLHLGTLCALFAGVAQIDCFAMFFQLYNCNQWYQWKFQWVGILLFVVGITCIVLVVIVCVTERKIACYIDSPLIYKALLREQEKIEQNIHNKIYSHLRHAEMHSNDLLLGNYGKK